jgi:ribose/xylose/arabinose/galactoside ABC-type transport system permease subunit
MEKTGAMPKTTGVVMSQMKQGFQPLLGLLIIYVIFTVLSSTFRSVDTFKTILTQAVILGTLAAGSTIVLISGGLDLSIGSIFCLVGVCTGLMHISGVPVVLVVIFSLLIGAVCGTLNGIIIVGTGIPAFIGTLGMMKAYRGLAEILGANKDMSRFPESFQMIGRGYLIPISIMGVTFLLVYIILSRTKLGFNCYAIGGSNEMARRAGVPVKKYYLVYYTLGGLFAAVSGCNHWRHQSVGRRGWYRPYGDRSADCDHPERGFEPPRRKLLVAAYCNRCGHHFCRVAGHYAAKKGSKDVSFCNSSTDR